MDVEGTSASSAGYPYGLFASVFARLAPEIKRPGFRPAFLIFFSCATARLQRSDSRYFDFFFTAPPFFFGAAFLWLFAAA